MNRWIKLLVLSIILLALALTAKWWLPPTLTFLGANSELIQAIEAAIQIVLLMGSGIAFLLGWQHRPQQGNQVDSRHGCPR